MRAIILQNRAYHRANPLAPSRVLPVRDLPVLGPLARRARRANAPNSCEPVGRALHAAPAAIQDVGVDHGRLDVTVAQQLLDRADVIACTQQIGSKSVAQRVRTDGLRNLRLPRCRMDRFLQHRLVDVVPPRFTKVRVAADLRGREHPLLAPFAIRTGILARQCVRQKGPPEAR
jgi:hypothetical protein